MKGIQGGQSAACFIWMLLMFSRVRDSGPFWMVLACVCFSTMGLFVKLGSSHFSTAELVFYRSSIALLIIAGMVLGRERSLRVSRPMLKLHLTRSIIGSLAMMLFFFAIGQLPLPTAITLQNTSPLFLMLISIFWLHSMPKRLQIGVIILGFAGVVILLQPTFASAQWFAGLTGLLAGLGGAVAQYNIRELGKAGEPEWRTVFYFSLVSTLFALIWMLLQWRPLSVWTLNSAGMLVSMGIFATAGQFCLTRAFRKGKTLVVATLSYLSVAITSLYGVVFWNDVLPAFSYLAMGLIALSGVLSSLPSKRD